MSTTRLRRRAMDPSATRPLADTGVHLTQVGFGSAPWESFSLATAGDYGSRYFDAAPFYGLGLDSGITRRRQGWPRTSRRSDSREAPSAVESWPAAAPSRV